MAIPKNKILITFWFVIIFILSGSLLASDWTNYASQRTVKRFRVINDSLYVTTTGGMLIITNPLEQPLLYMNNNGLGTNRIGDVIEDGNNQKWIGGNGRLIKFSDGFSDQFLFIDQENQLININCLVDDGDFIWTGTTDSGLVLFSKLNDGGQIEESYNQFGGLNPSPTINNILLLRDTLWLATSNGLAVGYKNNPQLVAPSGWTTFSTSNFPQLLSDTILNIIPYQHRMYVATPKAVVSFEFNQPSDTIVNTVNFEGDPIIYNMQLINDSLYLFYADSGQPQIAYLNSNQIVPLSASGLTSPPITGIGYKGQLYVSTLSGGIYFENNGSFEPYPYDGLPGNDISDITLNFNNTFFAGVRIKSFSVLDNTIWTDFNIWIRGGTTRLMTDSSGYVWLGTLGNGVWRVMDDTIINYDETNSTMLGNSDNPPAGLSYVYISGMATDGRYAYFACYRAQNGYPLAIADLENIDNPAGWDSVGVSHGLSNTFTTSLDYSNGRVAIGTESDGVFETFVGDNPFNSSKQTRHLVQLNSNLISDNIRVVKYDPNGDLWVGTNSGLSRYDPGIDLFRDVALTNVTSTDITALEFDNRGNLWIGTKSGLIFRDAINGETELFTNLNSELVADKIQSIYYHPQTGDIYIATDGGISVIPSRTGKPVFNIDEITVFPNPFIIDDTSDRLKFNYALDGTVMIFTPAGEQIIEYPISPWDGKNQKGEAVASGVYLFVITNEAGESVRGKFLLIRN